MKTKFEYVIVDKYDGYVYMAELPNREAARVEQREFRDCEVPTQIIQRKYELASTKVVR